MQDDSVVAAASTFKPASRVPLIVTGVAAFVGGALMGALITAASMSDGGKGKSRRDKDDAPVASASASAAPAASAGGDAGAADAKKSLAARATAGEAAAIKELEARPLGERTAAETLALARSRELAKEKEIDELARKIELVPKLAKEDAATRDRIKELLRDREVVSELLRAYAEMKSKAGPDLLYAALTSVRDDETERLAEELLYSKDVRAKASRELSVLLDLRKVEKCEEAPPVLERAKLVGDRRALATLMRFHAKRGCGEKKLDDCWPCLREGDLLKDATVAVQKKAPP